MSAATRAASGTAKIAVVLFNLGGPDGQAAVEPFLFNLFNDPMIIGLPQPARWLIARLIAHRRAPVARAIYGHLGGGSPLLANTAAQADALAARLGDLGEVRCFIAMRYWHPMTARAVAEVAAFAPDRIILLPLYPQFSTTTTKSSWSAWRRAARRLEVPTTAVCCYPRAEGFVDAIAAGVRAALDRIDANLPRRLLLSAHGLPERIVARGDPYRWQVEATCAAVIARLGLPGLDWQVCYQSRVGPLRWIGPATDHEIERAGRDKVALVVAPVAFVSEHSETLVELDIEYGKLAQRVGVPVYLRVPTVSIADSYIAALAELVRGAYRARSGVWAGEGQRICPADCSQCPLAGPSARVEG